MNPKMDVSARCDRIKELLKNPPKESDLQARYLWSQELQANAAGVHNASKRALVASAMNGESKK